MSTRATIVVKFGDEVADSSAYHAVAELDKDMNVNGNGEEKTSFNPGDFVYFIVQHDSRVRIKNIKTTKGQIESLGSCSRKRETFMLFTEPGGKIDFGYMGGNFSAAWFGNSVSLKSAEDNKVEATNGSFPANGNVTRSCPFNSYRLIAGVPETVSEDGYPVSIVIYMEVI